MVKSTVSCTYPSMMKAIFALENGFHELWCYQFSKIIIFDSMYSLPRICESTTTQMMAFFRSILRNRG